ncbi:MAG: RNA polymerase sigma factor [Candidatus Kapabacteria bacterium]|nr:RNA polymerase sigma factor [Candidatus Kapabacteria bacterium]
MQNFTRYSDEELIRLLGDTRGNTADRAVDALYERYSAKLNMYCIYKAKNNYDAEEIFEDTWMKFLCRIREGKEFTSVLPYLYSIAHNLVIDKYRANNSRKNIDIEYREITDFDEGMNQFNLQEHIEQNELIEIVRNVLAAIDTIYSETFILQWFGGLNQKEIAEVLGISLSAVKMRSHRAMKEVIKFVKPFYSDAENS